MSVSEFPGRAGQKHRSSFHPPSPKARALPSTLPEREGEVHNVQLRLEGAAELSDQTTVFRTDDA